MAYRVRRSPTQLPAQIPGRVGVRKVQGRGLLAMDAVQDLRGVFLNPAVKLDWRPPGGYGAAYKPSSYIYQEIEVLRNGRQIAVLPQTATTYTDNTPGLNPNYVVRGVVARRLGLDSKDASVTVITRQAPGPRPAPILPIEPPDLIIGCPATLTVDSILNTTSQPEDPTQYSVVLVADAASPNATSYVFSRDGAVVGEADEPVFVDTAVPYGTHTWTLTTRQPDQTDDDPPQPIPACPDISVTHDLPPSKSRLELTASLSPSLQYDLPAIVRLNWRVIGDATPARFLLSGTGLALQTYGGDVRTADLGAQAVGDYLFILRCDFDTGEILFAYVEVTVSLVDQPQNPDDAPHPPRNVVLTSVTRDEDSTLRIAWSAPTTGGPVSSYDINIVAESSISWDVTLGLFRVGFARGNEWGQDVSVDFPATDLVVGQTGFEVTGDFETRFSGGYAVGRTRMVDGQLQPQLVPLPQGAYAGAVRRAILGAGNFGVGASMHITSATVTMTAVGPGGTSAAVVVSNSWTAPASRQISVALTATGLTENYDGSLWAELSVHLDSALVPLASRTGVPVSAFAQAVPTGGTFPAASDFVQSRDVRQGPTAPEGVWFRITSPPRMDFRYCVAMQQGGDWLRVSDWSNVVTAP